MLPVVAEVIAVGDEMTSGARLDRNSAWLASRLSDLGVEVHFHTTVGDDVGDLADTFRLAARRAGVVLVTGGLGPTADDLTRQGLADAFGRSLVFNENAYARICDLFSRRGRQMPKANRVQAFFPDGACEIPNPRGTAPGIQLRVEDDGRRVSFFSLPGVPAEMQEMFEQTVVGRIGELLGGDRSVITQAVIKCFGLGESEMESRLGDITARDRVPRVGITVSAATISLRITAQSTSEMLCRAMTESTRQEILAKVGDFVFGEGEAFELQHAVAEVLAARGETLSTLEIGHAAPLAGWMSDVVPGTFAGGTVLPAASEPRASDLQQLIAARLDSGSADWLLVVDRYPSLRGDCDRPVEISFGLYDSGGELLQHQACRLAGHPEHFHARIAKTALAMSHRFLKMLPSPQSVAVGEP